MKRALLALLAACGTSPAGTDAGTPDVFLAFSSSFTDFRSWTSTHSDGPAPGTQPPNVLGPRMQYINTVPPSGSTEFPVGTIIVEYRETDHHILAGVKRGGDYNATGALNWEWFELTENPVTISWRGVGPPNGETYGGDPNGGCNSCHAGCGGSNDYVCSQQLQLSGF